MINELKAPEFRVGDVVLLRDRENNCSLKLITSSVWSSWEIPLSYIPDQPHVPILVTRDYGKECTNWEESAKVWVTNANFYRGLLKETAKHLGPEVFIADDGSVSEYPLLLKIPEVAKKLSERKMSNKSKKKLAKIETRLNEIERLAETSASWIRDLKA